MLYGKPHSGGEPSMLVKYFKFFLKESFIRLHYNNLFFLSFFRTKYVKILLYTLLKSFI